MFTTSYSVVLSFGSTVDQNSHDRRAQFNVVDTVIKFTLKHKSNLVAHLNSIIRIMADFRIFEKVWRKKLCREIQL